MKYTPVRENKPLYAVCIPLMIVAFLGFALGNFLPYASVYQAVGGIALVIFLFLNLRFALSLYRYEITDGSLLVYRRQGKREEALSSIDLSTTIALYTKEEYKKKKPQHEIRYNFCQNFAPKEAVYLLFVFDDRENKRALISFEPSDEMLTEVKKYL